MKRSICDTIRTTLENEAIGVLLQCLPHIYIYIYMTYFSIVFPKQTSLERRRDVPVSQLLNLVHVPGRVMIN